MMNESDGFKNRSNSNVPNLNKQFGTLNQVKKLPDGISIFSASKGNPISSN